MYESFVRSISFPIIARRNGLPDLIGHLRQLEKSQYWPVERLMEQQLEKIKSLLVHAYHNTPFYKTQFDESGLNPYKFRDFSELEKIPIVTKDEIRKNLPSFIAKTFRQDQIHASETGGTTGVKMKFYRDNGCLSRKEAALYRFEKWTGWEIGEKMGLVWTAQQDYVGHWTKKAQFKNELFGRQVVFPAARMDKESIAAYVDQLIYKKPTMVRAFVSPLYEVARYINNKNIDGICLKGVITTGEPLYAHQRSEISKAFNCEVFDSYRSREVGPIAQECENHSGMHVNAELLYIETVADGDMSRFDPDVGRIIITDLVNYGMPLIRYDIGDLGGVSLERCACGRSLPLMTNLAGRSSDIFFTPDGKLVTAGSLVLYLVDEAPGLLGQVQIVQEALDHLAIRMTPDPAPTEEIRDYQKRKVRELFGPRMRVTFEIVAEIPRHASGKYMFTICKINEDQMK